ncbi:hypothetical protein [Streptomyces sp. NPDC004376]
MNAIFPDAVHVRITPDGICFIDEEYFTAPPGTSLNEAVLAHLQLEAAALETPIRAVIHDEQAQYTTSIQVNTDGTSHPLDNEPPVSHKPDLPRPTAMPAPPTPPHTMDAVPADRPYEPLPEPYRSRLASACTTANQNNFAEAANQADQLLAELSNQYGPSHLYTLAVARVRGDIAWLSHDYLYGVQIWIFMARSWHLRLGPLHGTTIRAVSNALGCWGRLHPEDAKASALHVVQLLQDITIPNADLAVQAVNRRTREIDLVN